MHALRVAWLAVVLFAASGATATDTASDVRHREAGPAPSIPVEHFFRFPDVGGAMPSPSGRWLAVTSALRGGGVGLVTIDLERQVESKVIAHVPDMNITTFEWLDDEWLVFQAFYPRRPAGDQSGSWFIVSADGTGEIQRIGHLNAVMVPLGSRQPELIVTSPRYTNAGELRDVLPFRWRRYGDKGPLGVGSPPGTLDWVFDPKGEPRAVTTWQDGQVVVYWRPRDAHEWRELTRHKRYEAPLIPVFADGEGTLYVKTSADADADADAVNVIRRLDESTGKPAAEIVLSTPGYSTPGSWMVDPNGRVVGLRVVTDAETTRWFDPRLAKIQAAVDALLPGTLNRIVCMPCRADATKVLVFSSSDRDPGRFALFDVARNAFEPVAARRPYLDPKSMATVDLHRFRARDGLEIPVWVTMPPGGRSAGPRPAVVVVHDGPWLRGRAWGWSDETQFLASRGYVVLEPEYRGSAGYGPALRRAGTRQWGLAMQDDLADAARWAAAQGWIDLERVCIAGESFGGYAALLGVARDDDPFRCAVAWAPITDVGMLFGEPWARQTYFRNLPYLLESRIGDPVRDAESLRAISPIELAGRIRRPVLLGVGTIDGRVRPVHSTRMRDALRDAGNPPEWVAYENEGRSLWNEANRIDWARRMEAFLAKHLK